MQVYHGTVIAGTQVHWIVRTEMGGHIGHSVATTVMWSLL